MRVILHLGLLLAVCSGAFAQVKVPPMTGLLNDTAAMVPSDQRSVLERRLAEFSQATGGGQLVVLTIPTLDGEDVEGYAGRVFEAWKPGRKDIDDGALLLLVRDDRRSRLEIGYGWEGNITDARAGDILRDIAVYLAQGKTADGIASAIGQIQRHITGEAPKAAKQLSAAGSLAINIISGFITFFLVMWFLVRPFIKGGGFSGNWGGGSSGGGSSGGGGGSFSGGGGGRSGGGGASGRW